MKYAPHSANCKRELFWFCIGRSYLGECKSECNKPWSSPRLQVRANGSGRDERNLPNSELQIPHNFWERVSSQAKLHKLTALHGVGCMVCTLVSSGDI